MKSLTPGSSGRWPALLASAVLVCSGGRAPAAPGVVSAEAPAALDSEVARLARILRPDRTEQAALSPDGRYLAFPLNDEDDGAVIRIVDLDRPLEQGWTSQRIMPVSFAREQWRSAPQQTGFNMRKTGFGLSNANFAPSATTYLRWTTGNRLVYATDIAVYSVRADGSDWRVLLDIEQLISYEDLTVMPDSGDEKHVIVSTYPRDSEFLRGLRSGTAFFRVNVETGKYVSTAQIDGYAAAVYDRTGRPRIAVNAGYNGIGALGNRGLGAIGSRGSRGLDDLIFRARKAGLPGERLILNPYRDLDDLTNPRGEFSFRVDWNDYYGARSLPLAFGSDANLLYFASNKFSDGFGIYGLDLATGKRTELHVEIPGRDLVGFGDAFTEHALVFDHNFRLLGVRGAAAGGSALWLEPDMARIQGLLERRFSDQTVELISWNEARTRVLAQISTDSAPGSFVVVQLATLDVLFLVPSAPWIPPEGLSMTRRLKFKNSGGVELEGFVTDTTFEKGEKKPLIIYLHDIPDQRTRFGFNRAAQALSALGFVVLEFDYRGSAGRGRAFRNAVKQDLIKVPLEDLQAALSEALKQKDVDGTRVALLGEGFGGYLALRAVEEMPELFRAVIAYNAPSDPNLWSNRPLHYLFSLVDRKKRLFFQQGTKLPLIHAENKQSFPKPALLIHAGTESYAYMTAEARRWVGKSPGTPEPGVILRTTLRYPAAWRWDDWLQSYLTMSEFLNLSMFNYDVEIGELKQLE